MIGIGRVGLLSVLIATVLVPIAGCAGSDSDKAGGESARKPIVLTLADPFGDSEEIDGFAAEVDRLSGGTIRIDVKSRWRIGQIAFEKGLIGDVRAGKADLGLAGSRAWDSVGVIGLRALGAPLLIDSYALQERVLSSPLVAQMLKGLTPLGLVGLGLLPGPMRHPWGIMRPLLGPSDYVGLRIGVQQSSVGSATLRALGATPVLVPTGGSIAGLDGIEQGISGVEGNAIHRASRYLTTNVVLWPRPLVVFANRRALAKLNPAQQHLLIQAAADDNSRETSFLRNGEQLDAANLCRSQLVRFVTATPGQLAGLHRAVSPIYAALARDPGTGREITAIDEMGKAIAPQPAPLCASTAQPSSGLGPLDGVYQYTITYADLRAAHPVAGELVPENIGTYTWVLDRRHFATTTENAAACTWGYGTFTVNGGVLRFLFRNGGGIAPTGATWQPDENPTVEWSLYRDSLTMRRGLLPNTGAPTGLIAKAWLRVTTTPSARYLSKRCAPPTNALTR